MSNKGIAIVESLVAIVILSVILIALAMGFGNASYSIEGKRIDRIALKQAQEVMERLKEESFNSDCLLAASGASLHPKNICGTNIINNLYNAEYNFQWSVEDRCDDGCGETGAITDYKLVKLTVTSLNGAKKEEVRLVTLFNN